MIFRHSRPADVPAVAALFDAARVSMAALGIDQWQNGVPNGDNAAEDVMRGIGRVAEEDGEIIAAYSFIPDGEPDYDRIYDGEWRTDGTSYAAVHRVTVAQHRRGSGISTRMMEEIFREARAGGLLPCGSTPTRGISPCGECWKSMALCIAAWCICAAAPTTAPNGWATKNYWRCSDGLYFTGSVSGVSFG